MKEEELILTEIGALIGERRKRFVSVVYHRAPGKLDSFRVQLYVDSIEMHLRCKLERLKSFMLTSTVYGFFLYDIT